MNKKSLFLISIILLIFIPINILKANSNTSYGSHITTPFDMNHHITTYLDTNTGYLYIAGDNRYYNLGDNTTKNASLYFPAYKDGDSDNKFIDPIDWDFEIFHSAIVDSDGSLWTVGSGTSGMLATGSTASLKQFTQVSTPNDIKVKKVCATRGYSTIILLEDDTVWTIGNTTTTGISGSASSWVQVDSLLPSDDNKIVDFQGGEYASLYLTENGNLYSVGTTSLAGGSGSFITPKLTNVCGIDLMYKSTFALKNDGSIWVTGDNGYGQFGLGTTGTKSVFTEVPLSLLDNEFPVMVKGGIYTGYFLTNLGNMYMSGSDSQGQYGDGLSNSGSYSFKLVHSDVAYFDVGEYQTGVLFKDSSLKFFGQNDFGQLGIGTTTNVYDAYSDEAKLVSPLAEGLGSGLIPAVTLATYTPDLTSWPSECVAGLTDEEIKECNTQTVPIRPGEEHGEGESNTFTNDYGAVYIFSAPDLVNQDNDSVNEIIYYQESIKIFYEELNFESGPIEGYSLKIDIVSLDNNYSNTFYYGEHNTYSNYPKEVGEYEVTAQLLSKTKEVKTTSVVTYKIVEDVYSPNLLENDVVEDIENLIIINNYNIIPDCTSYILNSIQSGLFVSGDFTSVYNNEYVNGLYSNITSDKVTILYKEKDNDNYIDSINRAGDYNVYITIEPTGYTSSEIVLSFTISDDNVFTELLVHNDPSLSLDEVNFSDEYYIIMNDYYLLENYKIYISFVDIETENVLFEFEATEQNLNNFNLYPKCTKEYYVVSTIKNENEIISVKCIQFSINPLVTTNIDFCNEFVDSVVYGITAYEASDNTNLIEVNISKLLSDYLILDTLLIVNSNNELVYLNSNDYINYLSYQFYSSDKIEIDNVIGYGEFYIKFNFDIPNYIYSQDENLYKFIINERPNVDSSFVVFVDKDFDIYNDIYFLDEYYIFINGIDILFNTDIYCITISINNDMYNNEYIYCNESLYSNLPSDVGTYNVTIKIENIINDNEENQIINKVLEIKSIINDPNEPELPEIPEDELPDVEPGIPEDELLDEEPGIPEDELLDEEPGIPEDENLDSPSNNIDDSKEINVMLLFWFTGMIIILIICIIIVKIKFY